MELELLVAAPFIGSFIGVLIKRAPLRQQFCFGRSRCCSCGHILASADLIPILSWAVLRGKCRYCGRSFGFFYPFIEIAAVGIVGWSALSMPGELLVITCVLGWLLLALAVTDWEAFLLPDSLVLCLLVSGLLATAFIAPGELWTHMLGTVIGYLALALCAHLYRRIQHRDGLGEGDMKFMAAIGAWLSWPALPGVILLAATSCFTVLVARAASGRKITATQRIPFGTYLAIAAWISWLYGPLTVIPA